MALYPDTAPSSAITDMVSTLALWLAVAFLSESPDLYVTAGGHITDQICLDLSSGRYGSSTENAFGLIQAIGDLADGGFIGASVGARTSVSKCLGAG